MILSVCLSLTIIVSVLAVNARGASLQDMFNDWGLMGAVTDPSAYESQSRGVVVGGRLTIRDKIEVLHPFEFKLPSIKAGCGGIDIFAGSFSFINADELIEGLKAIGQNALGYAFSLALEVVCPVCAQNLAKLQSWMNEITKLSTDSCSAAKALVNTGVGAMLGESQQNCASGSGFADRIEGWKKCALDSEPNIRSKLRSLNTLPIIGNNPDEKPPAAATGLDTARLAVKGMGFTDEEKKFLISIVGTLNSEDIGDPTNPEDYKPQCKPYEPTIGLTELINGGEVKIWQCKNNASLGDNDRCQGYEKVDFNMQGYKTLAENHMITIYNKLRGPASGRALTQPEKNFVNRVRSAPILKTLYTLAQMGPAYESTAKQVIGMMAESAALDYAWSTVEVYTGRVASGLHNVSTSCVKSQSELNSWIKTITENRQAELAKVLANIDQFEKNTQTQKRLEGLLAAKMQGAISSIVNPKR